MASLRPVEVFGLEVPPGEEPVPAIPLGGLPATFRVTMAAIDPTISKEEYAQVNGAPAFTGATLRIIRVLDDEDSDEDSEDDEDFDMAQLLDDPSSEDESEDDEDDEEVNGGPSDPSKSPKAKREAARQKFKEALAADGHAMEIDDDEDGGSKLTAKQKGKAKAIDVEDIIDSEDDEVEHGQGAEEMVLCTLDLSKVCCFPQKEDYKVPASSMLISNRIINNLSTLQSMNMKWSTSRLVARIQSTSPAIFSFPRT